MWKANFSVLTYNLFLYTSGTQPLPHIASTWGTSKNHDTQDAPQIDSRLWEQAKASVSFKSSPVDSGVQLQLENAALRARQLTDF